MAAKVCHTYFYTMLRTWRVLRWPLLLLLVYLGGILLYGTLTDWQPQGTTALLPSGLPHADQPLLDTNRISLLSWNVGYGGLGAEEDFYYNRGDFFWTTLGRDRASQEHVEQYVAGQQLVLANTASDFFLLQEIDTASRRSYYTNQLAQVREARPGYTVYYAPNFRAKRVPLPLLQPWAHYGRVESGLVSLTAFRPDSAARIQLPGEFSWPTRLFQLDRCALRQVFPTAWGKDLVVYNVHLSAYDTDGSLRRQQMAYLRELLVADAAADRYVIVGGDWNQLPPGFNWFSLNPTVERTQLPPTIGFDYAPPGWQWAYDPATPTVRNTGAPYDAHRSERSLIDFFLVSPAVRIRQLKTIGQDFRFSDHQPVYLEAELLR